MLNNLTLINQQLLFQGHPEHGAIRSEGEVRHLSPRGGSTRLSSTHYDTSPHEGADAGLTDASEYETTLGVFGKKTLFYKS